MKKLLALLLAGAMAFSLAACGDKNSGGGKLPPVPSAGNGSARSTDFQQYMKTMDCFMLSSACETEAGWYFQYDAMLWYLDKTNMKMIVVCGKPDCNHRSDNKNCNAYINSWCLNYYDGSLYFSHGEKPLITTGLISLAGMNLDGTEHRVVQPLEEKPTDKGGGSAPIMHRGNVYFTYMGAIYSAPLNGKWSDATKLYGEQVEYSEETAIYWKLAAEGDFVYFMGNLTQSDKTQKDTLLRYDTNTREVKQVWQIPNASEVGKWETTDVSLIQQGHYPCGWYIKDGALYFYLSGNDLWRCDLNGGKNERVAAVSEKIPGSGFAIFNDDNIYIINDYVNALDAIFSRVKTKADKVFVYDYDGNLLKDLSLKELQKHFKSIANIQLLWGSGGKLFFYAEGNVELTHGSDKGFGTTSSKAKSGLFWIDVETGTLSAIENWPEI